MALLDNPERTRDDLLEAEIIMQDVVQRRRRVFGPAHPDTRLADTALSSVHEKLALATEEPGDGDDNPIS